MLERGISRSWGRSWPRFWGSWEGLGVVSGVLGPTLAPKKAATPPNEKNSKTKGPKILGSAASGLGCGGVVKHTIPKKA